MGSPSSPSAGWTPKYTLPTAIPATESFASAACAVRLEGPPESTARIPV